jgi:hypothetical protein
MDNTTFESASDTITDTLHGLGDTASRVSGKVSDSVESATNYVRNMNFDDVWDDVQRVVKANPAAALLGAVAVGFVVGRLLRR